ANEDLFWEHYYTVDSSTHASAASSLELAESELESSHITRIRRVNNRRPNTGTSPERIRTRLSCKRRRVFGNQFAESDTGGNQGYLDRQKLQRGCHSKARHVQSCNRDLAGINSTSATNK